MSHDSSSDSEDEGGGNTMMSLLTSYYGIESAPPSARDEPRDQIDAAGFDHSQYVKVLLCSKISIFFLSLSFNKC